MLQQQCHEAQVVKLVDTLASGASARKGVEVQVLSWAPYLSKSRSLDRLFLCLLGLPGENLDPADQRRRAAQLAARSGASKLHSGCQSL